MFKFEGLKKIAASAREKIKQVVNRVDSETIKENRAGIKAEVPNLENAPTQKDAVSSWSRLKQAFKPKATEIVLLHEPKTVDTNKTITLDSINSESAKLSTQIEKVLTQIEKFEPIMSKEDATKKMELLKQKFTLQKEKDQLSSLSADHTAKVAQEIFDFKEAFPDETFEQEDPTKVFFEVPLAPISREEFDYIKQSLNRDPQTKFSAELTEKYDRYKIAMAKGGRRDIPLNKIADSNKVLERRQIAREKGFTTASEINEFMANQEQRIQRKAVDAAQKKVASNNRVVGSAEKKTPREEFVLGDSAPMSRTTTQKRPTANVA
jgi:hypothetical protein